MKYHVRLTGSFEKAEIEAASPSDAALEFFRTRNLPLKGSVLVEDGSSATSFEIGIQTHTVPDGNALSAQSQNGSIQVTVLPPETRMVMNIGGIISEYRTWINITAILSILAGIVFGVITLTVLFRRETISFGPFHAPVLKLLKAMITGVESASLLWMGTLLFKCTASASKVESEGREAELKNAVECLGGYFQMLVLMVGIVFVLGITTALLLPCIR